MDAYQKFLAAKAVTAPLRGLSEVQHLAAHLFEFQRRAVDFALRAGASGCFLSTGMGKTECELEFAQKAIEHTNGRALLLTPLAVASQTKRRADRWGYEARVIREQVQAKPGINIINYDRLDKIDPETFDVVVLDEGSILKSFTGKTTRALIDKFEKHRFKMVATATPAPNDHMELGQYSEFLSIMPSNEMLMRWFVADQTEMGRYRLKGHATRSFWDWMASWARMAEKPSDLGDDNDARFVLPMLEIIRHRAQNSSIDKDLADMFGAPIMSATSLHDVKRQTIESRADTVAEIIGAEPSEPWLIWCDTNYEADALVERIADTLEVRGSQSIDEKESKLDAFALGHCKRLVGKPTMLGFGLDWSHCANMIFVGRSYSYETYFQAVRRCWRFGQTRPVKVHLVIAEGEDTIAETIDRKAADHATMLREMCAATKRAISRTATVRKAYDPRFQVEIPTWLR